MSRSTPARPSALRRALTATALGAAVVVPLAVTGTANAASDSTWDALAVCESGGNWSSTVGSYDGGLQFSPSTWNAYGGQQYAATADRASRAQQIAVAEKVLAGQGWGAWPTCSAKTGASGSSETRSVESGSAASTTSSSSTSSSSTSSSSSSSSSKAAATEAAATKAAATKAAETKAAATKAAATKAAATTEPVEAVRSTARADRSQTRITATAATGETVTVVAGDTLAKIAAREGTTWRALFSANSSTVSDPDLIYPGQVLSIG